MATDTINTLEELTEAHLSSQYHRLTTTEAGRDILRQLRYAPPFNENKRHQIPPNIHDQYNIPPLPRNIHPEFHIERRKLRAKKLERSYGQAEGVYYVDAAAYTTKHRYVLAVVDNQGNIVRSASIKTTSAGDAEEAAIALASGLPDCDVIISDSKTAIRNFSSGYITNTAHSLLVAHPPQNNIALVWTPAHQGLRGNEMAHAAARGFTDRVAANVRQPLGPNNSLQDLHKDSLITFHEICTHYRHQRLTYPPLSLPSTRQREILWRQLQTRTFLTPRTLHLFFPATYQSPKCRFCPVQIADLSHIMWQCPMKSPARTLKPLISSEELWETALRSSDPTLQDRVLRWAEEIAEAYHDW